MYPSTFYPLLSIYMFLPLLPRTPWRKHRDADVDRGRENEGLGKEIKGKRGSRVKERTEDKYECSVAQRVRVAMANIYTSRHS